MYIHSIHFSCASWVSLDLSFKVVQVIRWNFVCQLCDQPLLAIIGGSVVHFPHENSIFESISVLVLIPLDAVEKGWKRNSKNFFGLNFILNITMARHSSSQLTTSHYDSWLMWCLKANHSPNLDWSLYIIERPTGPRTISATCRYSKIQTVCFF